MVDLSCVSSEGHIQRVVFNLYFPFSFNHHFTQKLKASEHRVKRYIHIMCQRVYIATETTMVSRHPHPHVTMWPLPIHTLSVLNSPLYTVYKTACPLHPQYIFIHHSVCYDVYVGRAQRYGLVQPADYITLVYLVEVEVGGGGLLLLYDLATSKVISRRVLTCDCALMVPLALRDQVARTMTWYTIQAHYPDTESTRPFPTLIVLSHWD